jgi:rhodanese-related sulfurtransferase
MKMSKYQVDDRDRVVLVDLKTRLTIINCTRLVGDELSNNNQYEVIDVSKAYVRCGKNAKALDLDEIPSERDVNRYAEAFVQFSSAIAAALEKGKNVVCYCNNGRSRSPSVAAAFYIIYRGMSLNEIKMWYKEAYHKQRPETARDSVNFPNLHRFEQILVLLQKCLANPNETVQGFNLAGKWICGYINCFFTLSCGLFTVLSSLPSLPTNRLC